ncbi:MAG: integrase core domain-containing protein [Actinomycetota bacterium]
MPTRALSRRRDRYPHLIRAPNAFCERWVDTVRAECLDWALVLGRRHLERVLRAYVRHYNEARPHGGSRFRRRSEADGQW